MLEQEMQASSNWIDQIYERTRDGDSAYLLQLCTATLGCVRRGLPPAMVAELSVKLPLPLRGMLFEDWHPDESRIEYTDAAHFVRCVRPHLIDYSAEDVMEEDVLAAVQALFECQPAAADLVRGFIPSDLIGDSILTH